MSGSLKPWWHGVPTKLIRKTTLIPASPYHFPVHTLTFEIPNGETFSGRAIPHKSVQLDMGDVVKMVIPNYKPKSYSMSALREDEFDVTYKVYPNGRASGYLDRLQVGHSMNTFGVSARRRRNPGEFVGIIAYGLGMTEALPVARAELEKGDAKRVTLLWASRAQGDIFWFDQIQELVETYGSKKKFEMVHIRSREQRDGCLHGHIDPSVLECAFQVGPEEKEQARFLSVGTKEMMSMTDNMLSEIGYPMPKHALIPK